MRSISPTEIKNVVREKCCGVAKRSELQALIARLRPDDVLSVYKLDRLSRSLRDLLKLLDALEERRINFCSRTESIDTNTPASPMFCHMLGTFAEFERAMVRERCAAGFEAARARGQKYGRDRSRTPKAKAKIARTYQSQKMPNGRRVIYEVTKLCHRSLQQDTTPDLYRELRPTLNAL